MQRAQIAANIPIPHVPAFVVAGRYLCNPRHIGEGSQGTVTLVYDCNAQKDVAVKTIHKIDAKSAAESSVMHRKEEVEALKSLKHPNILALYAFQETASETLVITEYCAGGALLETLNTTSHTRNGFLERGYSEKAAANLFSQLVSAIDFAHQSGWVHRDIKLDNLFLREDGTLVVGDWGFAHRWAPNHWITESFGSIHYCPPELLMGKSYIGPEVDIWAMGVVLYALVEGQLPFLNPSKQINRDVLLQRMKSQHYALSQHNSMELRSLIRAMLFPIPEQRATMEGIKNCYWLKGFRLCQKLRGIENITAAQYTPTDKSLESDGSPPISQLIDAAVASTRVRLHQVDLITQPGPMVQPCSGFESCSPHSSSSPNDCSSDGSGGNKCLEFHNKHTRITSAANSTSTSSNFGDASSFDLRTDSRSSSFGETTNTLFNQVFDDEEDFTTQSATEITHKDAYKPLDPLTIHLLDDIVKNYGANAPLASKRRQELKNKDSKPVVVCK